MKKSLFFLWTCLGLINCHLMSSQELPISFSPNFVTPNTWSFLKYGEFPVSEYSGHPDINIPIYTIQDGSAVLPISLDYHPGGIKVAEEASWVGLGWTLRAGGEITRIVNGVPDDNQNFSSAFYQFTSPDGDYESIWNDFYNGGNLYDGEYITCNQESYSNYNNNAFNYLFGGYGQPDYHNINIPGFSDKFFVDFPREDKNYETYHFFNNTSGYSIEGNQLLSTWLLTSPEGVKYKFNEVQSHTEIGGVNYGETSYLSKILYPNGDYIDFEYESGETQVELKNFSEISVLSKYGNNCSFCEKFTEILYNPLYLKTITTKNYKVIFNRDENFSRLDIKGESALTSIEIIDNINGKTKKTIYFEYEHFVAGNGGDEWVLSCNNNKRLKLVKIYELLENNEIGHAFTYNSTALPSKKSKAVDYWGYYNGVESNTSLLPTLEKLTRYNDKTYGIHYKTPDGSANRGAHQDYMKAGILERIDYPTGGYTEFDYEPHKFNNYYYEDAISHASPNNILKDRNIDGDIVEKNITISEKTIFSVTGFIDPGIQDLPHTSMSGSKIEIISLSEGGTEKTWILNSGLLENKLSFQNYIITLLPGLYRFKVTLPDELGSQGTTDANANVTMIFHYYAKDSYCIGAGLRIRKITSYQSDGKKGIERKFLYEEDDNYYGKLLKPLIFSEYNEIPEYDDGWDGTYKLFSSNGTSSSAVSSYSSVGYDKIIIQWDELGENGRIEKLFYNELHYFDENALSMPLQPNPLNGYCYDEKVFQSNNSIPIKHIYRLYVNDLSKRYDYCSAIVKEAAWQFAFTSVDDSGNPIYTNEKVYKAFIYPIFSYHIVLDTKKEKNNSTILKETTFKYNDLGQLLSESFQTSDKKNVVLSYKYPYEYKELNNIALDMYNNNFNSLLMQKSETVNGSTIRTVDIEYLENSNSESKNFVPYQIKTTSQGLTSTESTLTFNSTNLIHENPVSGVPVSYLWGYNEVYPIAKVDNADNSEVFFDNYEEENNDRGFRSTYGHHMRSDEEAYTGNYSWKALSHKTYNLVKPIIKAEDLDQNSKYIFSVWVKCNEIESGGYVNASVAVYGTNSERYETPRVSYDASKIGEWQLLKIEVDLKNVFDNPSSSVDYLKCYIKNYGPNSLNVPAYYDDAKFYPADAQMKTYTYDPIYGITSETDIQDRATIYEYDKIGRLIRVRDHKDFIIQQYNYNYAQ